MRDEMNRFDGRGSGAQATNLGLLSPHPPRPPLHVLVCFLVVLFITHVGGRFK